MLKTNSTPEVIVGNENIIWGRETPREISLAEALKMLRTIQNGCVLPFKTRRFPHPFPARMPLEVAWTAISQLSHLGDTVVDPMVGGGTTAVACASLDRSCRVFDLDPLAALMSGARVHAQKPEEVETLGAAILQRAQRYKANLGLPARMHDDEKKFIKYWFPKNAIPQLIALLRAIDAICTKKLDRALWLTIFSSLIISRTGVTYARDLPRSRPHKVKSFKPPQPFELWQRRTKELAAFYRCDETIRTNMDVRVARSDARKLRLKSNSVGLILTSPPYLNAIDYMRTSKFSLVFLKRSLADLRTIRSKLIGTERGLDECNNETVSELLRSKRISSGRARFLRRYLLDLSDCLRESFRILQPGRYAVVAVGPRIISRRKYDGGSVLAHLAEAVGFVTAGQVSRAIAKEGRSLPPPKQGPNRSDLDRRMNCEIYVCLRKPKIRQ
jgi:DNA modification methylase